MILKDPLKISARLLPALQVAGAWISLDPNTCDFFFDLPEGVSHTVEDYYPPTVARPEDEEFVLHCFDDLFVFISAQVDAYEYFVRTGRHGGDHELFEQSLAVWMFKNRNALEDAQLSVSDRLEEDDETE